MSTQGSRSQPSYTSSPSHSRHGDGGGPLPPRSKTPLYIGVLVSAVMSLSYSTLVPFFPAEAAARGVKQWQIGIIFGVFPLFSYLTSNVATRLAGSVGAARLEVTGLLMESMATIGFAWLAAYEKTTFFLVAVVLRAIQGVGSSFSSTGSMTSILSTTSMDQLGPTLGYIEAAGGFGMLSGPLIGGALFQYAGGYRMPFLVCGGLDSLLCFIVLIGFRDKLCVGESMSNASSGMKWGRMWRRMASTPVLVGMVVITSSFAMLSGLDPILGIFLQKTHHFTPLEIGAVFSTGTAVYALISPLALRLAERLGYLALIPFGLFLSTAGLFMLGPSPLYAFSFLPPHFALQIAAVLVLVAGVGTSLVPATPFISAWVKRRVSISSEYQGSEFASLICNASFSLGAVIGPILSSILVTVTSFRTGCSIAGGITGGLLVLLLCLWICKAVREPIQLSTPLIRSQNARSRQDSSSTALSWPPPPNRRTSITPSDPSSSLGLRPVSGD